MPAAAPPPPPPQFEALTAQREARQAQQQEHKQTVERCAFVADAAASEHTLPAAPCDEARVDESGEHLGDVVLGNGEDDDHSVSDGFAALRAQRAQRKRSKRALKKTTLACRTVRESASGRVGSRLELDQDTVAVDPPTNGTRPVD